MPTDWLKELEEDEDFRQKITQACARAEAEGGPDVVPLSLQEYQDLVAWLKDPIKRRETQHE